MSTNDKENISSDNPRPPTWYPSREAEPQPGRNLQVPNISDLFRPPTNHDTSYRLKINIREYLWTLVTRKTYQTTIPDPQPATQAAKPSPSPGGICRNSI